MSKTPPQQKPPNSKDVAILAGVSQASVSRVFNSVDGKGASPKIIEKVLSAANKLGYVPNYVARGMISGKTDVIGLVISENIGAFYHEVITGIMTAIQKYGKHCLVITMHNRGKIEDIIKKVLQFQVEGIIITAPVLSKEIENIYKNSTTPIIVFNRIFTRLNVNAVCTNPIKGGEMAARYLLENGHKNIGYVRYEKETNEENEKEIGFYSELRKNGIYDVYIEKSSYQYEAGYKATKRLLKKSPDLTAIFFTTDLMALGGMDFIKLELGKRVPEEISILGYDDISMSKWKSYNLDTIKQPVEILVNATAKMLINMIDQKINNAPVNIVELTLEKRGSVADINGILPNRYQV